MSRIRFQKRQKEMKRQQKQQLKAEKRAMRKLEKTAQPESGESQDILTAGDPETSDSDLLEMDDVGTGDLPDTSRI